MSNAIQTTPSSFSITYSLQMINMTAKETLKMKHNPKGWIVGFRVGPVISVSEIFAAI
jgi:hypothetical protein